jgi:hypothetical protein
MQFVETALLFLVVFATFYSCLKLFNDLPASEKAQNALAVLPSFTGILAFLLLTFVVPPSDPLFGLLTTNLFPTVMVAITLGLLIRLKSIRGENA